VRAGLAIALAILLAGLAGCSEKLPAAPAPTSLVPDRGPPDRSTAVKIVGAGFQPILQASYDDPDRLKVNAGFSARLGSQALAELVWVSASELHATVPAGLARGVYDLEVTDPRGRSGGLPKAFTITGAGDAGSDGGGDGPRSDGPRGDGPKGDAPRTDAPRGDLKKDAPKKPDLPRADLPTHDLPKPDLFVLPGVWVTAPAGTFTMGSPSSEACNSPGETQHQVTLTHAVELSATEVTQAQFQLILGYSPASHAGCATCPVDDVSWHEAVAYCNALSTKKGLAACYSCSGSGAAVLCGEAATYAAGQIYSCPGYRLPTEAEWEYAYRAKTTTALYSGDLTSSCSGTDPVADQIAWYSGSSSQPVAGKTANAWGLFDMAGNVWEWVHDLSVNNLGSAAVTDPWGAANGTGRVYRGGSWFYGPKYLRAAYRASLSATGRSNDLGFRCARTK